jgi:hypothetical protein
MKRTFLSLLLFIAGNGLMVTQAHAVYLDNLKNQALQYFLRQTKSAIRDTQKKTIGTVCFFGGLSCLALAGGGLYILPALQRNLNLCKNREAASGAIGSEDSTPTSTVQGAQNNIKLTHTAILKSAAIGIPLTALGTYLLLKK